MKTASSFPIRKLMLATAFSAGIGFVPSVSAFDYSALDLGNLGSGSNIFGFATSGLNATGQVTGYSFRFEDGMPVFTSFITGANGVGVTDLNALNGTIVLPSRINATGQVAGSFRPDNSSDDDPLHAFITGPNGLTVTDIGTLGGTDSSIAVGLNDSGQVVGASFASDDSPGAPTFHAFITGPDGADIRALVPPGGSLSAATDINTSGQAVGFYGSVEEELARAFITGPNGMDSRDLGTLGGVGSWANAINDLGQVVGFSSTGSSTHAFITGPNGANMTDLGALGEDFSAAADVNASGQVVGSYGPSSEDLPVRAFITGANGADMADLTSLVRLPSGVVLEGSSGLNDRGQILAFGNNDHAYLLTPGDGSTVDAPLFPNSIEEDRWRFDFDTQPGQMVFVDPLIAVGYDYMVNSGPNFQSALFPSVAGDTDGYDVFGFNAQTGAYDVSLGHVNPGEVFSFSTGGVSRFALRDIDLTAGLDPDNPLAFPTGLTFVSEGAISMVQSPIAVVPEPETYALLLAGLGIIGFMAGRKKQLSLA